LLLKGRREEGREIELEVRRSQKNVKRMERERERREREARENSARRDREREISPTRCLCILSIASDPKALLLR
jgi:hypothetical protein